MTLLRLLAGMCLLCVAACAAPKDVTIASSKSPVELRAMQVRGFDTTDKRKVVQAVISTLQDMSYSIDKVDYASGTISSAKLERLRLTAVVYPRKTGQMAVRANAVVWMGGPSNQVDDPLFYQQLFFEPLAKSLFLDALAVEDDPAAPVAGSNEPRGAPPAPGTAPDPNVKR